MRITLGTTKTIPIVTTGRSTPDLLRTKIREAEEVKGYLTTVENPLTPLHEAVKDTEASDLRFGRSAVLRRSRHCVQTQL